MALNLSQLYTVKLRTTHATSSTRSPAVSDLLRNSPSPLTDTDRCLAGSDGPSTISARLSRGCLMSYKKHEINLDNIMIILSEQITLIE